MFGKTVPLLDQRGHRIKVKVTQKPISTQGVCTPNMYTVPSKDQKLHPRLMFMTDVQTHWPETIFATIRPSGWEFIKRGYSPLNGHPRSPTLMAIFLFHSIGINLTNLATKGVR